MLTSIQPHTLSDFDNSTVDKAFNHSLAAIRHFLLSVAMLVLMAAIPASLSAQAIVTELQAMKSVTEISANGVEKETLLPVTTILPGERVVYTLNYGNQSDTAVNGVVISLPMPKNMSFVPGSADRAGTSVTYSVDGGTTFDLLENLTIISADGFERPARASDVTAIRWSVNDILEPQQFGAVRCIAAVE